MESETSATGSSENSWNVTANHPASTASSCGPGSTRAATSTAPTTESANTSAAPARLHRAGGAASGATVGGRTNESAVAPAT